MLDRNHRLVEAAGLLLAVYNGERRGGTAVDIYSSLDRTNLPMLLMSSTGRFVFVDDEKR